MFIVPASNLKGTSLKVERSRWEGLRVAAYAEDGTIEAVEDPQRRFALGVLWHPEAGEDARLFDELVREAGEYRARR